MREDGRVYRFGVSGSAFVAPPGVTARLVETGTGYQYIDGDTIEDYDNNLRIVSVRRKGEQLTWTWDPQGRQQAITDSFGRSLTFGYDASNRWSTVTDPDNKQYSYGYDASNRLLTVTGPDEKTRTYHYEDARFPNALTGLTDENNVRFATWAYDAMGRAKSSEHAGGVERADLTFNSDGTTTVKDALNTSRTYAFSQIGEVFKSGSVSQPCPSCGPSTASTTYDANGFVDLVTDFNGHVTDYDYNARGLEEQRIEAKGTAQERTITTQWHPTDWLPTQIDEPGRRTTYTYFPNGLRQTETIKDTITNETRTTAWAYTAQGLVDTVDGPRTDVGDVTDYNYDASGNLIRITNALNQLTEIPEHDAHGNPKKIIDPNGVETTLTYDLRQRLKTRTVAGATTVFDYDGVGQLDKVTLPGGAFLDYTYDAAHRLTDIQDNLGNRIHYTLDLLGNRAREEVLDPSNVLKRTQTQVFNDLGRLQQIKNAANQIVTEYGYDAQGNRTGQTDAGTYTTTSTPDALNRIKQVTDAASGVTQYGYNALDQLISVTDPENLITSYTLNALGDLTQQVSPDTGTTNYTYDSAGNRKTQTDARGITATYSYDALNRLTFVDFPSTAEDITYIYDGTNYSGAVPNGKGRLTGITDESGTTTLIYDARGNVIEERRVIGGSLFVTGFTFDSADRLAAVSYPGGRSVAYERDVAGRISKVTTTLDGATTTLADSIRHMPFGGVAGYTLGNGIAVTRAHDLNYRIEEVKDQGVGLTGHRQLYYDLRNNIDAIQDLAEPTRSQSFDYDALARLSAAEGAYGAQGFSYDGVGNRLTETSSPPGGSASTDAYGYLPTSHRLQSISGGRNVTFEYDAAGNTLSDGRHRYGYSSAGRLVAVDGMEGIYRYNAAGQRVTKPLVLPLTGPVLELIGANSGGQGDENSPLWECLQHGCSPLPQLGEIVADPDELLEALTLEGDPGDPGSVLVLRDISLHFVYDRAGRLLGEYRADGVPVREHVWLEDLPLSLINRQDLYYVHSDHLGTPHKLTDSSQAVAWDALYEPFGEAATSIGLVEQPLRFPGQYADAEVQLHQNWWRDYDPGIGRYLQSDPIGLLGGISTFGYVGQNPLRYFDLRGLRYRNPEPWEHAVYPATENNAAYDECVRDCLSDPPPQSIPSVSDWVCETASFAVGLFTKARGAALLTSLGCDIVAEQFECRAGCDRPGITSPAACPK